MHLQHRVAIKFRPHPLDTLRGDPEALIARAEAGLIGTLRAAAQIRVWSDMLPERPTACITELPCRSRTSGSNREEADWSQRLYQTRVPAAKVALRRSNHHAPDSQADG